MALPRWLALSVCLAIGAALVLTGCKPAPSSDGSTVPQGGKAATSAGQTAATTDFKGPVKMYFVPSAEAGKIMTHGRALGDWLEKKLGVKFDVEIAPSYAAVVEGLGSDKVDVAWMPTYAYILAHDKYETDVALMCIRRGEKKYRGMFVTRGDTGIESLKDVAGKTIAYTDAASTSGYIYPSAMLAAQGIKPKRYLFAGSHQAAMLAVYSGTADVACGYWSPADEEGNIKDARKDIMGTYPDAAEVLKTFAFTEWIPNDNLSFRKGFPADLRQQIVDAILEWVKTPEGAENAKALSDVTGFEPATDSEYDGVRELIAKSGQAPEEVLKALDDKAKEAAAAAAAKAAATESTPLDVAAKKP